MSQVSTTPAPAQEKTSFLDQPRAVWAVAFACVIAFMGIGLVDPILKPIADQLDATPSQVSLLFTSYMAVMGVAMLITGVVSTRIGAKRTLLSGLALIIVFSALAGSSSTIGQIVGVAAHLEGRLISKPVLPSKLKSTEQRTVIRFTNGKRFAFLMTFAEPQCGT